MCSVITLQSSSNSPTFPHISSYSLNHHRYTDRPMCTRVWILGHYWQPILCTSTLLNSTPVGYHYFATIATAAAQHRQITISLTFPNFHNQCRIPRLFQVFHTDGHRECRWQIVPANGCSPSSVDMRDFRVQDCARQRVTLSFCNTKVLHLSFTPNNRFNT